MDVVDRVGALAVVALVALGALAVVDQTRSDPAGPAGGAAPVQELVEAWARSRTATYRATGTFERTGADGAHLEVGVELAQRPPDRVVRQFGEVTGHRGDRPVRCPAPMAGHAPECELGPPGRPYHEVVAAEVTAFRGLVTGDQPLYAVERADPGCWRMTRTRPDPRGGFGVRATICVDDETGALRSVVIDHGSVDERTAYDDIRPEVTDEDLELPAP